MENQGIVLTRDNMLETIWGYDFDGETRTAYCSQGLLSVQGGEVTLLPAVFRWTK